MVGPKFVRVGQCVVALPGGRVLGAHGLHASVMSVRLRAAYPSVEALASRRIQLEEVGNPTHGRIQTMRNGASA